MPYSPLIGLVGLILGILRPNILMDANLGLQIEGSQPLSRSFASPVPFHVPSAQGFFPRQPHLFLGVDEPRKVPKSKAPKPPKPSLSPP